jgi:N-methylhydantoinase A
VLASKAPTTRGDLTEGVFAALGRVVDETATTVIPPGCLATVDANGFLIIKVTS